MNRFCEHGFARLPTDTVDGEPALISFRCPLCFSECPPACPPQEFGDFPAFGWEDVLHNVAGKRGFWRNEDDLSDVVSDLRAHLIQKRAALKKYAAELGGWNTVPMAGMVGLICKNFLIAQQTKTVTRADGTKARETKDAYLVRRGSVTFQNAEGKEIPWAGATRGADGRLINGNGCRRTAPIGHDSVSPEDGPPSKYTAAQRTRHMDDFQMRQAEAGVAAFRSSADTRMPAIANYTRPEDIDLRHVDAARAIASLPRDLRAALEVRYGSVSGESPTWPETAALLGFGSDAAGVAKARRRVASAIRQVRKVLGLGAAKAKAPEAEKVLV